MSMLPLHHPVARRSRLGRLIALLSLTLLVACAAPPVASARAGTDGDRSSSDDRDKATG